MLSIHQGPTKATKKVLESRRGAEMMLLKPRSSRSRSLRCKRLISPIKMFLFWRVMKSDIYWWLRSLHGLPHSKKDVGSVPTHKKPLCVEFSAAHVDSHTHTPPPTLLYHPNGISSRPPYNSVSSFLILLAPLLLPFFIANAETVLIYTPSSTSSLCPHPFFT